MQNNLKRLAFCLTLTALAAFAQSAPQTKLTFEVASIKPSAPLDMAKIAAGIQNGQMPKIGPHVDNARAEYTYMALRELIVAAYKVKPYQITGPDWLASEHFDIVAKMPEGSTKDDAPKMLQALLEERFKLTLHRETKEHPVLALVIGKGGPKLKESPTPTPIDENVPLKQGEMGVDTPDGPVRMTIGKDGSATVNMGTKGTMRYRIDPASMTMHLEGSAMTMSGFADMLTQFSMLGGAGDKQVVDMTDLKGNYEVAFDFNLSDLIAMARAQGMDVPAGAGATSPIAASDPGGASSTLFAAVSALGLKLEQRKAPIEQLIIDHIEKAPTEN
jgi:uncharacterized protein (TIGR03435 family)